MLTVETFRQRFLEVALIQCLNSLQIRHNLKYKYSKQFRKKTSRFQKNRPWLKWAMTSLRCYGNSHLDKIHRTRNLLYPLQECGCQSPVLVYTTQVNSTFRARWLANSEVISQVLFTSEQPKKNKMDFVGMLSQIKLLFGPPVIQLMWSILKQLFTSVSVKVVDIYLHFGE